MISPFQVRIGKKSLPIINNIGQKRIQDKKQKTNKVLTFFIWTGQEKLAIVLQGQTSPNSLHGFPVRGKKHTCSSGFSSSPSRKRQKENDRPLCMHEKDVAHPPIHRRPSEAVQTRFFKKSHQFHLTFDTLSYPSSGPKGQKLSAYRQSRFSNGDMVMGATCTTCPS